MNINSKELVIQQQQTLQRNFNNAVKVVDDIVLKNYLSELHDFQIIPLDRNIDIFKNEALLNDIRIFKITEMVYAKDEQSTYKFATVFSSLANSKCSVFIIIDSNGVSTDFYMGVRTLDENITANIMKSTLEYTLKGQFPGVQTKNYMEDDIINLLDSINGDNISVVSCVANNKLAEHKQSKSFIQGLEKLAIAMQGEKYTGIILANSTSPEQISQIRRNYEDIYTKIAPFAKIQTNYSYNSSTNSSWSKSRGTSDSYSDSISHTNSTSSTKGKSESTSKSTTKVNTGHMLKSAAANAIVSAGVTAAASMATGGLAAVALIATNLFGGEASTTKGTSTSISESTSQSESDSKTHGHTRSSSFTDTETTGSSEGSGRALTLTLENKTVSNILERINVQLKRLQDFESQGMWECAAYFMSGNSYTAEIASSTYKALMSGENSGVEISAINSWKKYEGREKLNLLKSYILNMLHPIFAYNTPVSKSFITPCSAVSSNELAIHMGLPRKSICGFPVIEHAEFGKEVVNYAHEKKGKCINLGKIFKMGIENTNKVELDIDSLAMHTFITGSTGSGKSNTVYEILRQLEFYGIKYLVIEPAKGEYKHVLGNKNNVKVFGTNPVYAPLLKINPFKFPKEVHVFEHIDRLIEIFNVCWPMYAAMPAILKDAILNAYKQCGWDLTSSTNYLGEYYPNFKDVLEQLVAVIDRSSYDIEVKSNYKGSLETRIHTLTNGLNGQIFTADEIPSETLFDSNVIVDLSRIGSLETKALIMGILIMRLNEHRSSTAKSMNEGLKHVTVLEEAHNILKKISTEQNVESSNVAGKAVEMLSNTIAEVRTYGEGFIIADQSPNAVDMSAIRNTNTKIIMRLPDEADRRLAGKSAALRDDQLDEIAKLPKGVAVVYQNDWLEPVLCKVNKKNISDRLFTYTIPAEMMQNSIAEFKFKLIRLLLGLLSSKEVIPLFKEIKQGLPSSNISEKNKIAIEAMIKEYNDTNELSIWHNKYKSTLFIFEILDCNMQIDNLISQINLQVIHKSKLEDIIADSDYKLTNIINQELKTNNSDSLTKVIKRIKIQMTRYISDRISEDKNFADSFYTKWYNFILN